MYASSRNCTIVTKDATTTIKAGTRTPSGMIFRSMEIIRFDSARITVVVSPIPIPLMALVVTASVGHMPSISTKVGFSFTIPFQRRSIAVLISYTPCSA